MRRLLLVALLALSGCVLRYSSVNGAREIGASPTHAGPNPPTVVIITDGAGSLCSPDDPDPQHTCPAKAGPDPQ